VGVTETPHDSVTEVYQQMHLRSTNHEGGDNPPELGADNFCRIEIAIKLPHSDREGGKK